MLTNGYRGLISTGIQCHNKESYTDRSVLCLTENLSTRTNGGTFPPFTNPNTAQEKVKLIPIWWLTIK